MRSLDWGKETLWLLLLTISVTGASSEIQAQPERPTSEGKIGSRAFWPNCLRRDRRGLLLLLCVIGCGMRVSPSVKDAMTDYVSDSPGRFTRSGATIRFEKSTA